MNQIELDRVNAERRRRNQTPLSRAQAETALARRPVSSDTPGDGSITGSFAMDYLIGLQGIPLPSVGGLTGYAASPSHSSYDSGSSSSSYDSGSSSSSSSDSGGGGGGGE